MMYWGFYNPQTINPVPINIGISSAECVPEKKTGTNYWWRFLSNKNLFFIESGSVGDAINLIRDEFGVEYDANKFNTVPYKTLEECLNEFGLVEESLVRPHGSYRIYVRTKERKVYRSERDGIECVGCDKFCPMVLANMPGGKFQCYSCKNRL